MIECEFYKQLWKDIEEELEKEKKEVATKNDSKK